MTLFLNLAAKIRLDARLLNGQRVETDTLVGAEYTLNMGGVIIRKTLDNGLTIEADDSGEGFLYASFAPSELNIVGTYQQRLTVAGCDGQMYGAIVRPELLYVKE